MKRLVIVLFCAGAGSFIASAQKITTDKVPEVVRASFIKAHPHVAANWDKEGTNYEANFKEGSKAKSCVINNAGIILETETGIPISELPIAALSFVKEYYKGAKIKEAAKIVKSDGEVNYEAEVRDKDVVFDSNGIFIKEEKD